MPSSARPCRLTGDTSCNDQPSRAAARLKAAGLRHAQCLFGRKRAHQHVADAVMERVAARQHGHRPAAMLLDFRQHVADRTRPRDPLTLNQRVRQGEVPLAAHHQLGVGHQLGAQSASRPSTPSSPMPTMDSQRCGRLAHGHALRVLILGGTTEASALARQVAGRSAPRADPLARRPHRQPAAAADRDEDRRLRRYRGPDALPARRGDRGGDRCHASLRRPDVGARGRGLPRGRRAAWRRWCGLSGSPRPATAGRSFRTSMPLPRALGATPRRVFLSLGRQELHAFAAAPQHHYIARLIERPEQQDLPPDLRLLQARGPFDREAETARC